CEALFGRAFVDVGEAHLLHGIQAIEVPPELLETVRRRQCVGVVAQMVLAELPGVVTEIEQEFGHRWCSGLQVGRAAGRLRRGRNCSQWVPSRGEVVESR